MSAEATTEFDDKTKELGDKIVGLTLLEAKRVVDYLKQVHGIEPAGGGAVMMAGPAALRLKQRLSRLSSQSC
jgi:large subunit ribosomal protein L7/L12